MKIVKKDLVSLSLRFFNKIKKTEDCWIWTASTSQNGYGKISFKNKPLSAHVVSYIIHNGCYNKKLQIDHICRVRNCVNPSHLRLVTRVTNILENSNSVSAVNKRKTHCVNGHEFTKENTRMKKETRRKNKTRVCISCIKNRKAKEALERIK